VSVRSWEKPRPNAKQKERSHKRYLYQSACRQAIFGPDLKEYPQHHLILFVTIRANGAFNPRKPFPRGAAVYNRLVHGSPPLQEAREVAVEPSEDIFGPGTNQGTERGDRGSTA
jgi:hypothetical protein